MKERKKLENLIGLTQNPETKANDLVEKLIKKGVVTNEQILKMAEVILDSMLSKEVEKENMKKYYLSCDANGDYRINDVLISTEAADEVDWAIEDREGFISELRDTMIPEASKRDNGDYELMIQDLKYLEEFNDKLILSSKSTNEYMIPSNPEDEEGYLQACRGLLEEMKAA